jgi:hypothetical protein
MREPFKSGIVRDEGRGRGMTMGWTNKRGGINKGEGRKGDKDRKIIKE